MFAVRLVQTLAEWQALKPVWEALISADPRASLCNTWEWNDAWMQQFWHKDFALHVLIVERGNEAVALLPLYVSQQSGEAQLIGTGEPEQSEVASEYLELLLDESKAQLSDVLPLLSAALRNVRCGTISFINCLENSRLMQLAAQLPRVQKQVTGRQFGVALSQSLAELMHGFSYKQRKNGQLLLNRFDKNSGFTFEVLLDATDDILWQQLQELHQADWMSRQKQGAFASDDFVRFHERLHKGSTVMAKFAVLKHEREVVAVNYYYQFRQHLYYYQSGTVKDRFQQYSPGKMLHMLAFRQLAGSDLYYDFMKGAVQGSYKAAMCPEGELFYDVVVYQGTVAGMWRYLRDAVKRWFNAARRSREGGNP